MKRNKYEIIIETEYTTSTLKVQGGRFRANKIYKRCCECVSRTEDIYAVFLVKNDSVIKQYYAE